MLPYPFFQVFEVWQYDQSDYIFREFLSHLACLKIRYSEYPAHVKTDEEKERFCTEISEKMGFKGTRFELTPADITPNKEKRLKVKTDQNALLGECFLAMMHVLIQRIMIVFHFFFFRKMAC